MFCFLFLYSHAKSPSRKNGISKMTTTNLTSAPKYVWKKSFFWAPAA